MSRWAGDTPGSLIPGFPAGARYDIRHEEMPRVPSAAAAAPGRGGPPDALLLARVPTARLPPPRRDRLRHDRRGTPAPRTEQSRPRAEPRPLIAYRHPAAAAAPAAGNSASRRSRSYPLRWGRDSALVGGHAFPRVHQERRVVDEVEQVAEPAGGIFSRPAMQLSLHPPYREIRRTGVRPLHSTGIHRRVFGHYIPPMTDTLPPFPMYAAFPRSEYYGGSAPSAPSAGVAPIPAPAPGRGPECGTHADGSHVPCSPVDGLGTRLFPCGIVTATP